MAILYRPKSSKKKPWQSFICENGRKIYLGSFETEAEARSVYDLRKTVKSERKCSNCGDQNNLMRFHKLCKSCHVLQVSGSKSRYGMSLRDFEDLKMEQNGKCRICLEQKPLVIDHCHKTGIIRGLLCHRCNLSIGSFKDNSNLLIRAAHHVENGGLNFNPKDRGVQECLKKLSTMVQLKA